MYLYEWIIGNKELLKIFYALIIGIVCFFIVLKTDRLFRISLHQGIRYFRNAFLFYGLAFIIRYFIGAQYFYGKNYSFIIKGAFEYLLIMAGFFLLYSLLWKKFEGSRSDYSSLFNSRIFLFYLMAFILVFLDYLWRTYYFMFFSQIILFLYASIISYLNYKKNGKKYRFLKFYFMAMMFSLAAWLLNSIAALYLEWNQGVLMGVYLLNIIIFLLFLYGVVKVTRKW